MCCSNDSLFLTACSLIVISQAFCKAFFSGKSLRLMLCLLSTWIFSSFFFTFIFYSWHSVAELYFTSSGVVLAVYDFRKRIFDSGIDYTDKMSEQTFKVLSRGYDIFFIASRTKMMHIGRG